MGPAIFEEYFLTEGLAFWLTFYCVSLCLGFFMFVLPRRGLSAEIKNRHNTVILNASFREYWMWITQPLFKLFIKYRVHPNMISCWGTVLALLSGVAFAEGFLGFGGWLMVIGASLDFFDGRVARETNRVSLAGSFLDSSLDRISEALTLTGLAYLYRETWVFWLVMAVYLGSMLTSYTKAKGDSMGVDYSGGMMQRPERIVYLGAGAILTSNFVYLAKEFGLISAISDPQVLILRVYIIPLLFVALFCNSAVYNRITNIMKLLQKREQK